jgi:alpha-ketoglutarate-dependent taurine dioxygenase
MCNAGLVPERTVDPGRAFHLWSSDGAVILTSNRTDAAGLLAGARAVFGPRILAHQLPMTVVTNTALGQVSCYDPVTVNANAGVRLEVHIDGYMAFGDYYPDLVFLLCERQASAGGESFLVDGQRLLGAIAGDPTQRLLSRFLWEVKLEQGRPDGVGPAGNGKPAPTRRPVASRTCAGRLTVRRHHHQRLLDDAPGGLDDHRHLAAWARFTEKAAQSAPRFLLQPGDLLCLDNYRVFHGREPYTGYDRVLHKLWAWSDMAFGLPSVSDLAPEHRAEITAPSR